MRHGFLLIDKPLGYTSHDAVARVRKTLGERSIGHLGTLDPNASGLLVLAVGKKALKVVELFSDLSKEYEAEITLDATSSTYDAEGHIEAVKPKPGVPTPDEMTIRRVIESKFIGSISQVPPAYSAVHVQGTRAYDLARRGEVVQIPSRIVRIDSCDILSFHHPIVRLRIACSSGTYIRSLAHDLGIALRTGGYLSALRRTAVGNWRVEDAVSPDRALWSAVLPLKQVLQHFPRVDVDDEQMNHLQHGRSISVALHANCTLAWHNELPVALLKEVQGGVRARKVL